MSSKNQDSLWITKRYAVSALEMSQQNFDQRIRPRMKPEAIRGDAKQLKFHLPAVIRAWHEHQIEMAGQDASLLSGGDSPALERWREARAQREERQNRREEGELVEANEILPALLQGAGIMRRAIEQAQRQYGNEIAELFNGALDETIETWKRATEVTV